MIETFKKTIGNSNYEVTQLPARRALRLQIKLIRIFGSSLAKLLNLTEQSENFSLSVNMESLQEALPLLFEQTEEEELSKLIVFVLSSVRKDGVELTDSVIDMEFCGKLDELLKVFWYVIEVNYSSFWKEGVTGKI